MTKKQSAPTNPADIASHVDAIKARFQPCAKPLGQVGEAGRTNENRQKTAADSLKAAGFTAAEVMDKKGTLRPLVFAAIEAGYCTPVERKLRAAGRAAADAITPVAAFGGLTAQVRYDRIAIIVNGYIAKVAEYMAPKAAPAPKADAPKADAPKAAPEPADDTGTDPVARLRKKLEAALAACEALDGTDACPAGFNIARTVKDLKAALGSLNGAEILSK